MLARSRASRSRASCKSTAAAETAPIRPKCHPTSAPPIQIQSRSCCEVPNVGRPQNKLKQLDHRLLVLDLAHLLVFDDFGLLLLQQPTLLAIGPFTGHFCNLPLPSFLFSSSFHFRAPGPARPVRKSATKALTKRSQLGGSAPGLRGHLRGHLRSFLCVAVRHASNLTEPSNWAWKEEIVVNEKSARAH